MKKTDIIAEVLKKSGVKDFFAVTGGAAVHIIDSLITVGDMTPIFHHHEQAASLAADAYARMNGLGVCVVTTGPGVTNAMTGLLCSWQDSVPTIFISGQARYGLTSMGKELRQVGTQHLEVIPIVKNLTKKSIMLQPGDDIQEVLSELICVAQSGRKGPVWLDIPLDLQIQTQEMALSNQKNYKLNLTQIESMEFEEICTNLRDSKSPLFLFGRGLNNIDQKSFTEALEKLNIPCVRTWGFFDTNLEIPKKLDFGSVGVSGQRGANKIISEADLVISFGARWGQAVVGPSIQDFAPNATIHLIEIDELELERAKEFLPNIFCHLSDASLMIQRLKEEERIRIENLDWMQYCENLRMFNFEQISNSNSSGIDQYDVFFRLNSLIGTDSTIVVDGGGTIVYCSMQILDPQSGRRVVIPSASAPMGTGLPHAIGTQIADPSRKVILICGDGSFPFNMQELQTILTNALPIKIIIISNGGYLSIQGTQNQFLEGRHFGSAPTGGLDTPNFKKISAAFNLRYWEIETKADLDAKLWKFLDLPECAILEIHIAPGQEIFPRTAFKKLSDGKYSPLPLSEMHPPKNVPGFASSKSTQ